MNRGQEQDLRNTGTMYRLPVVLLVAKLALSHRQTPVAMQSVLFHNSVCSWNACGPRRMV